MADTIMPTKNFVQVLNVSNSTIGTSGSPNVTSSIALGAVNQSEIYIAYVQSSLTALNVIVEVSQDNQTWFQKTLLDIANGSSSGLNYTIAAYAALYQMSATGNLVIDVPVAHAYYRLRVWGTGSAGAGDSVTISVGGGAV